MQYVEIDNIVKQFTDVTYEHFKSHGFSSGYLGSMLTSLIHQLPAKKQHELMLQLQEAALKYTGE